MKASSTRVVKIVDRVYQIIELSFLFWKVLIKKRIIYGWLSALKILLKETYALHGITDSDKSSINTPYSRLLSFLITCSLSLFVWGWFVIHSSFGIFLFIMGVTGIVFLLPFSIFYLLEENEFQEVEGQIKVYWAIRDFWRESKLTLFLISSFILMVFIFLINKILFICFVPGFFGEIIYQSFTCIGMQGKKGE